MEKEGKSIPESLRPAYEAHKAKEGGGGAPPKPEDEPDEDESPEKYDDLFS